MSTSSSTLCPNCCALLEVLRFVIQIYAQQTIDISREHQGQGITVNDASYSASQQIPSRDDLALFDSNTGFYTSGAQGLLPRHTDIVPAEDIQTSTNTMSYNETHFVNQLTAFDNFSSHAPAHQVNFGANDITLDTRPDYSYAASNQPAVSINNEKIVANPVDFDTR